MLLSWIQQLPTHDFCVCVTGRLSHSGSKVFPYDSSWRLERARCKNVRRRTETWNVCVKPRSKTAHWCVLRKQASGPSPGPSPAHVPNSLPWRGELAAVTHLTHGSLQRIADSQHGVVRESELVEWMFICSIAILQSHMLVVIHCRQEIPARFQENFSLGIPFTF